MPLKANFSAIGKALPPDTYELVLDNHKEIKTKKGGTMCSLGFRVAAGDYEGKRCQRGYMVDGDGAYYLMEALVLMGADPEELSPEGQKVDDEGVDLDEIIKGLYGVHVLAKTGIRADGDREYTDIQSIKPLE